MESNTATLPDTQSVDPQPETNEWEDLPKPSPPVGIRQNLETVFYFSSTIEDIDRIRINYFGKNAMEIEWLGLIYKVGQNYLRDWCLESILTMDMKAYVDLVFLSGTILQTNSERFFLPLPVQEVTDLTMEDVIHYTQHVLISKKLDVNQLQTHLLFGAKLAKRFGKDPLEEWMAARRYQSYDYLPRYNGNTHTWEGENAFMYMKKWNPLPFVDCLQKNVRPYIDWFRLVDATFFGLHHFLDAVHTHIPMWLESDLENQRKQLVFYGLK